MNSKITLALFIVILIFSSCNEEPKQTRISKKELKEQLIKHNQKKVRTEDEILKDYLKTNYPEALKTSTGLRYVVYPAENRGDRNVKNTDIVIIDYSILLLNDREIYSSKKEGGPELFRVEHEDAPAGLHEGLQLMNIGDSAVFIIPSYLAYGFTGDQNAIGQNAILVYKVVLMEIE